MNGTPEDGEGEVQGGTNDTYRHGSTVGPSISRRRVLQGIGAAGAATMLGTGTAAADHGSEDPIDITDPNQETNGDYEDVDPARIAAGAAVGGAMVAGPVGAAAGAGLGFAAGSLENEYEVVGDWMYGSYENRVDTQLQTDIYSHSTTASNENAWNLQQFDNRLELGRNTWIAEAQFKVIQALNAEENESTVVSDGIDGVLNAVAASQESLLAIETAAVLRYASFDAREDIAEIPVADQVTQPGYQNMDEVLGVKPLHIDLVNGETVEAWGLHVAGQDNNGNPAEYVVHSHLDQKPLIGTDDPDLPISATRMCDLVEEASHNPDGTYEYEKVEYTGPGGDTMDTSMDAGHDALLVTPPTDASSDVNSVKLFDPTDLASLSNAPDPAHLSEWWTVGVYPLISVLCSEIETYAKDVYGAVESGQINVDDLITPSVFAANLARDWSETGDTGMSRELLANLGVDTDLETSMDIVVADQMDPTTVVAAADRGHSETWTHSLAQESVNIDFALKFRDAATDGSGGVIVPPNGEPTIRATSSNYTDSQDSPTWAIQSIDVTTAGGTTVTARVGSDGDGGGIAELWHEDLGSGSYTISTVDVTYTSGGSEYTETVASPGLDVTLDPVDTGWTYADAALATDWRPHGGVPEEWSTTVRDITSFTGVSMSETSSTVDVQVAFAHDGDTDGADTFTVPDDQGVDIAMVAGDTANVTGVVVSLANQASDVTATVTDGSASIPHADLLPGDDTGQFEITDVTIEYNDGGGGTATTVAGTVGATLIPETIDIPEYDFLVGNWYSTGNMDSDESAVIVTEDGGWVDIETGDAFKITSATDVDGNAVDGVTLSDTNRHTLDVTRVEEEVTRSIELQQKSEGGGGAGGGGGGGGGGGMNLGVLGVGAGALGALYLWATQSGDSPRR
jgi:hypothetical protein